MAYAIIPSEQLSHELETVAAKMGCSVESVVIKAVKRFLDAQDKESNILEVAKIQFSSPFRIP